LLITFYFVVDNTLIAVYNAPQKSKFQTLNCNDLLYQQALITIKKLHRKVKKAGWNRL